MRSVHRRYQSALAVGESERPMSSNTRASNTTATTQILEVSDHSYAYRRFGGGPGLPLLLLQHFTGTLDNWDPAVTDPLAAGREVILFDNAGLGRSSGEVPPTIAAMARHPMAFLEALGIERCDVLGYSLGGMVALQMVQDRPSIFRRMILVGTAPRGGEDIMHLEKPSLAQRIQDPTNRGYDVLKKIFFAASPSSQAAGEAFIRRLSQRKDDLDPISGPKVAGAQITAFREWEQFKGERFAELRGIRQPVLVVNGVGDEMIPVSNSYRLGENLPNAVLLTYPERGTRLSVPVPGVFHATRGRVPLGLRRGVGRILIPSTRMKGCDDACARDRHVHGTVEDWPIRRGRDRDDPRPQGRRACGARISTRRWKRRGPDLARRKHR